MNSSEIRDEVLVEFISLQTALIDEVHKRYKEALIGGNFYLLPRSGVLTVGNYRWRFQKHGLGIRFTCIDGGGEVVDAHVDVSSGEVIDGWRIAQFLESRGFDLEEGAVNKILEAKALTGTLQMIGPGKYRLAD